MWSICLAFHIAICLGCELSILLHVRIESGPALRYTSRCANQFWKISKQKELSETWSGFGACNLDTMECPHSKRRKFHVWIYGWQPYSPCLRSWHRSFQNSEADQGAVDSPKSFMSATKGGMYVYKYIYIYIHIERERDRTTPSAFFS